MVSWRRGDISALVGRVIFHVDDVDEFYKRAIAAGLPAAEPKDAPGVKETRAHSDPSGHDLSFAKRIRD